jgi:Putative transposase
LAGLRAQQSTESNELIARFLCRFLLHLLPKGFVRIRNFGFLANRRRATLLPILFSLD